MTKPTIATADAEAHLGQWGNDHRVRAHDLQSEATALEAKATEKRSEADKLLDLAAQADEAVRDIQAHRREHPLKDDKKAKA